MSEPSIHQTGQTIPTAEIIEFTQSESRTYLVLRANIEGRDHELRLGLDALGDFAGTAQAAVGELRKIQKSLAEIAGSIPLSTEVANDLFAMIEANYRLPKRETG